MIKTGHKNKQRHELKQIKDRQARTTTKFKDYCWVQTTTQFKENGWSQKLHNIQTTAEYHDNQKI